MTKIFGILESKGENSLKQLLKQMSDSYCFGSPEIFLRKDFGCGRINIPTNNGVLLFRDNLCVAVSGYIPDYKKQAIDMGVKISENESVEDFIFLAYKSFGKASFKKLNGVFNILIYDDKSKELLIVNDRLGMKPIYYFSRDNLFIFGSEIKSIIQHKSVERDINWNFWKDYFSYGYGLNDSTPILNIKSLPAGNILSFKNGSLSLERYWHFNEVKINLKRSESETISQGIEILKRVFARQTQGLDECIVMLSGGYDSRCIASSIKLFTDADLKAFTIARSYPVMQPKTGDKDAKYGRAVAEALDIEYKIVGNINNIYERYFAENVWMLDGMSDEHIWAMPVIDVLDDNVINFDGIAGDVLLKAGYLLKPEMRRSEDLSNDKIINSYDDKRLASVLHQKMLKISTINPQDILIFFNKEYCEKIIPDDNSLLKAISDIKVESNKVKIFQLDNRTRNSISLTANGIITRKVFSRFPFCDNEFVDFALSIPVKMKVRNRIYFKILKAAFPKIMQIPTTNDPKDIKEKFHKKMVKYGFNSMRYAVGFLSRHLKPKKRASMKKLSDNPRDVNNLIKLMYSTDFPDFINKKLLYRTVEEHIYSNLDPSYFLEPIMHFCIWHDIFIKGKRA